MLHDLRCQEIPLWDVDTVSIGSCLYSTVHQNASCMSLLIGVGYSRCLRTRLSWTSLRLVYLRHGVHLGLCSYGAIVHSDRSSIASDARYKLQSRSGSGSQRRALIGSIDMLRHCQRHDLAAASFVLITSPRLHNPWPAWPHSSIARQSHYHGMLQEDAPSVWLCGV